MKGKLLLGALALALSTGAFAQTKLKWAHVYETSEPLTCGSVWSPLEMSTWTVLLGGR